MFSVDLCLWFRRLFFSLFRAKKLSPLPISLESSFRSHGLRAQKHINQSVRERDAAIGTDWVASERESYKLLASRAFRLHAVTGLFMELICLLTQSRAELKQIPPAYCYNIFLPQKGKWRFRVHTIRDILLFFRLTDMTCVSQKQKFAS